MLIQLNLYVTCLHETYFSIKQYFTQWLTIMPAFTRKLDCLWRTSIYQPLNNKFLRKYSSCWNFISVSTNPSVIIFLLFICTDAPQHMSEFHSERLVVSQFGRMSAWHVEFISYSISIMISFFINQLYFESVVSSYLLFKIL